MDQEEYEILLDESIEDAEKLYMLQLMGYDLEDIFFMALDVEESKRKRSELC